MNNPPGYDQAIEWLWGRINFERTGPPRGLRRIKLDRIRQLLTRLGCPDAALRIVHVAGTKGKGSTCTLVESILRAAGYRTGLYTSPHLERFEERIAINGAPCSPEDIVKLVARVQPCVAALDRERGGPKHGPTYFDIATAMALTHFANQQVDYAVVEVGLGGRLDSTNVCLPMVSVITSIGMDHMKQLGNTLEEIAAEKAGIIKPGVPVISGVTQPGPQQVIAAKASELGSRLSMLGAEFTFQAAPVSPGAPRRFDFQCDKPTLLTLKKLELGLRGAHQLANAAIALATIAELNRQGAEVSPEACRAGIAGARVAARIELIPGSPAVILDAAHNDTSAEALAATLRDDFPPAPRTAILAMSRDKDVAAVIGALRDSFTRFVVTNFVNNPRAIPAAELAHIVEQNGVPLDALHLADSPVEAWLKARLLTPPEGLVVITGSFFLAAELRPLICSAHPR